MNTPNSRPSRRGFLAAVGAAGAAASLGGCVGSGGGSGSSGSGGGGGGGAGGGKGGKVALTIQSDLSDPGPKAGLKAVVDGFTKYQTTINTIPTETFRAQLPTYLSSSNPPDVITWLAGSVARDYASKGFLLDLSSLWTGNGPLAHYSKALRELSTDNSGKQIFVPTSYYWWSIFYRKSMFKKWGVTPPKTWDAYLAMCRKIKSQGVNPLISGIGSTAWMTSGWFDYLDLRVNGAQFHRELLAGKHRFDSPQVKAVMARYAEIVPFFDPAGKSYSWQEAVTPFAQGKAAMYLAGTFIIESLPSGMVDDIDFFRVPVIKPGIPIAEEAPTDGFFASSKTQHPEQTKELLAFIASPANQQKFIAKSKSTSLPTATNVDQSHFSPLVKKGIRYLQQTDQITQFFNRDSSDELQTTADTALTKFIDNPGDVDSILAQWQAAAEKVWKK